MKKDKIMNQDKVSDGAMDNTVAALKFQPTADMKPDKNGVWRYKAGTSDEFGKKLGGTIVKGSPSNNPAGSTGIEKEVVQFCREVSMDMALVLYTIAMDIEATEKARIQCANSLMDRGLGKPKQQTEHIVPKNFDELIRPIIIKQS